jgi:hypothetical protein
MSRNRREPNSSPAISSHFCAIASRAIRTSGSKVLCAKRKHSVAASLHHSELSTDTTQPPKIPQCTRKGFVPGTWQKNAGPGEGKWASRRGRPAHGLGSPALRTDPPPPTSHIGLIAVIGRAQHGLEPALKRLPLPQTASRACASPLPCIKVFLRFHGNQSQSGRVARLGSRHGMT